LSPLSTEEVSWLSEDTFYQTSQEHDDCIKFEHDLVPCESKAEVASLMLENLENLINLDELIKEEPFLLDEKILPILEDVEQPRAIEVPLHPTKMEYTRTPDTQFLLKEFETVYDVIEFTHETLTPPQSPPSEQKILTTLEPLLTPPSYTALPEKHHVVYPVPEKPLLPDVLAYRPPAAIPAEYPSAMTPQPDIAHELAVVDELVRTRVEDMQWSSSGPSSPNSSGSSNFGDCSSDDPEWMPEPVENYDGVAASPKQSRKRSKPYSRTSPVDKKSRKKEQNKNAATRYRMKKKAEVEVILTEEKGLSMKNDDLELKIKDMQREIKYLKGLMRDLFKAKGLIN
jgi:cyclic AMP-dependent transcription factor ATF-4